MTAVAAGHMAAGDWVHRGRLRVNLLYRFLRLVDHEELITCIRVGIEVLYPWRGKQNEKK